MVTLIQRQQVPFAYVPGTVHPNLANTGELTVQGLLGVKLQPTIIPTTIGSEEGDPLEYFDMGWICWGTADGFDNRERLTHSPQLSLPNLASTFPPIGYSFPPRLRDTIPYLLPQP